MLQLAGGYLEDDQRTYRQAVRPQGLPIFYRKQASAVSAADELPALHHSTLWCMLAWLGSQCAALAHGRQLIQREHPASTCHRFVGAVAPQRFRSLQRQRLLCRARQLLHLIAQWDRLFPEKFFPRFATKAEFW